MADDKHPYERVTPDEIVAQIVKRAPEIERDEARQLHQSLQEQWEPLRERYEVARLLARWLFYTFFFVVVWSGILMLSLLVLSATTSRVGREEIDIVTDFVKDLLPYIATPLGVALGFYFREVH
jgi:hypothetical protein